MSCDGLSSGAVYFVWLFLLRLLGPSLGDGDDDVHENSENDSS